MISKVDIYNLRAKILEEMKGLEDQLKECRNKLRDIDIVLSELIKEESREERLERKKLKK